MAPQRVAILLCKDLAKLGNGLDLRQLCSSMGGSCQDILVEVVPDLCDDLSQIPPVVAQHHADGVVLGLCSGNHSHVEVQARAKKAGLDPFALEAVPLGTLCATVHPKPEATRKAQSLLAGAVAKVRAFEGSGPDNTRLQFLPKGQKVSRRTLLTTPPVGYRPVANVREELCAAAAGCQLCIAACPKGVFEKAGGRLHLDKAKCESCGLCLSACPRGAIEVPGWSLGQVAAQLGSMLEGARDASESVGILFMCQRAVPGLEGLARRNLGYSHRRLPVSLPCVGMVTPAWTLQVLGRGAAAITFLSCDDHCPFGQADTIQGRIDFCRTFLSLAGQPPDRARLASPADPEGMLQVLQEPLPAPEGSGAGRTQGPLRLGDPEDTAATVQRLAETSGRCSGKVLEHPRSPFGLLEFRPEDCTWCMACVKACPTGVLVSRDASDGAFLEYKPRLCTACNVCADVCPERSAEVLRVRRLTDLGVLSVGSIFLGRQGRVTCERCGAAFASEALLRRITLVLRTEHSGPSAALLRYCPSCRMAGVWSAPPSKT